MSKNAVRRHKSTTRAGIRHRRRWSVCSSKARMLPRRHHPSRRTNATYRALVVSNELMSNENVIETTVQLFLFVVADDDAGIFLDSRDIPSSSRSAFDADDLLPGTSRCTPSDIVYRCLGACGCFCRCPLPFLLNRTLTCARSHASTTRRMFEH